MKKKSQKGTALALGAGAAALGGAAYYLLGPDAKKHQAKALKWAKDGQKKAQQLYNKLEKLEKEIKSSATKLAKKKLK